jgi:hypothetical protein
MTAAIAALSDFQGPDYSWTNAERNPMLSSASDRAQFKFRQNTPA